MARCGDHDSYRLTIHVVTQFNLGPEIAFSTRLQDITHFQLHVARFPNVSNPFGFPIPYATAINATLMLKHKSLLRVRNNLGVNVVGNFLNQCQRDLLNHLRL
jgi:hypothetical protein